MLILVNKGLCHAFSSQIEVPQAASLKRFYWTTRKYLSLLLCATVLSLFASVFGRLQAEYPLGAMFETRSVLDFVIFLSGFGIFAYIQWDIFWGPKSQHRISLFHIYLIHISTCFLTETHHKKSFLQLSTCGIMLLFKKFLILEYLGFGILC